MGTGNVADATQKGDNHITSIDQNGIGNMAHVNQSSLPGSFVGNRALISQLGNNNSATVRQQGVGYVANVNQTGSGNWTSIYQH
jgi:secreted PhoX family phosphatase